jgi:hypothetical protein
MGLSITFNGSGTPQVSDPNALSTLESGSNGQELTDALKILATLNLDSYNGVPAGSHAGNPLTFTLDGGPQVTLPNPGGVLNQLSYSLNGNVTNAQLVSDVNSFLTTTKSTTNPSVTQGTTINNLQSGLNWNTLGNPSLQDLMTPAEADMLNNSGMTNEAKQQFYLQLVMEFQSQLETLLTNVIKMHHDTIMSVVGNIRSS